MVFYMFKKFVLFVILLFGVMVFFINVDDKIILKYISVSLVLVLSIVLEDIIVDIVRKYNVLFWKVISMRIDNNLIVIVVLYK